MLNWTLQKSGRIGRTTYMWAEVGFSFIYLFTQLIMQLTDEDEKDVITRKN